jgi:hypothetical protein
MDTSIFEQITSALTVKSLCSPLGPDIPWWSTFADLENLAAKAGVDPFIGGVASRVIASDGSVTGIIWFEDYLHHRPDGERPPVEDDEMLSDVEEVMQGFEPNELLSSDTTILDAVEIFGSKSNKYFYVLHINQIVGVIFYSDLFKPLGRLAFLALALEIEDQALRLCQSASINERCWLSLPENRRCKAIELFIQRNGREPNQNADAREFVPDTELGEFAYLANTLGRPTRRSRDIELLIGCTPLVDKATMIWKQKLITSATGAEVLGFFKELNAIRDQCAHPGGEETLIPKERLSDFVKLAKRMRNSLRESM